jgi:hypothetical protein
MALNERFDDLEKKDEKVSVKSDKDDLDSEVGVDAQIARESGHAIRYRTCSWQKVSFGLLGSTEVPIVSQTAALLFSEYICLAIMSFPWSVLIWSSLASQPMIGFVLRTTGLSLCWAWFPVFSSPSQSPRRVSIRLLSYGSSA